MIKAARRMETFHSSIFIELEKEKEEYEKRTGQPAIDFSLGSPNIAPSKEIIESLVHAAREEKNYKYAVKPLPALIGEIQNWYEKRYNTRLDQNEITLLQGSQEALINLPLVFCNPGDLVLVPDPYYPAYVEAPRLAEAKIGFMPLKEENDYLIDFDAIPEDVCRKAKLMIVCYPNNPTGASAPDWFIEKLIEFAGKNDILVIYDNAYSELVYEGTPGKSFLSFPHAKEVGVEINSFSKTYGMAGARLGTLCGNEQAIRQYKILKSNMDYGIFLPVQYAGITALRTGGPLIVSTRAEYEIRRCMIYNLFRDAGWDLRLPEATMFFWAAIPDSFENSIQFAKELLNQTGIIVTPGLSFGDQGRRYVRIAMVVSEEEIEEAARRLKESDFFQVVKKPEK